MGTDRGSMGTNIQSRELTEDPWELIDNPGN